MQQSTSNESERFWRQKVRRREFWGAVAIIAILAFSCGGIGIATLSLH